MRRLAAEVTFFVSRGTFSAPSESLSGIRQLHGMKPHAKCPIDVPRQTLSCDRLPHQARTRDPNEPEATESIAFISPAIFLLPFSAKIACQAPKPLKSNKQNKIELAF
jgi:hypothetical protein